MGYASIMNLYADTRILEQPECYALEKIHGTSALIGYVPAGGDPGFITMEASTRLHTPAPILHFHSGEQQANFESLFDKDRLLKIFGLLGAKIKVHGECYGGKIQRNAWRYGSNLRFTAFDVNYNGEWLTIPEAENVVKMLGLEFVHYVRIETKLSLIDAERDATSEQAIRNGVTTRDGEFVRREGVVLRPINEVPDHRGNRVCAKHKRAEERETKTIREVDPNKIVTLAGARAVAEEWVVEGRIANARSHHTEDEWVITNMKNLINYVRADVEKEAANEVTMTPEVNREVCKRAAQLIKQSFANALKENQIES